MTVSHPEAIIVLAAGEGTRMRSRTPKLLHAFCGRSIIGHVLAPVREQGPERLIVVVGHSYERVSAHVREFAPEALIVPQPRRGGTGHAVRMVIESLGIIQGTVVVTNGDAPLIRSETFGELVSSHRARGNAATVLTARVPKPYGYGRIQRDEAGTFIGIVEEADATSEEQAIDEINSGCYAFDGSLLTDAIKRLPVDNALGQEYLTDVVAILCGDGHRVGTVLASNPAEIEGVNDLAYLAQARRTYNDRLVDRWMRAGVSIIDPRTTWIDVDVVLEPDAEIGPGTHLEGRTVIGAGARVGPGCLLRDTTVAEDAVVLYTVSDSAEIGAGASVGPFARLRPGTRIGPGAHIGTNVELKNATVGEGSKVPHLTYVGDADIGVHSNIGAATIFVNYDGIAKHRSTVGDHVRIGADNMLIAPVQIGDGAYTAAGSVITEDVPPGALGVARGKQHNSEGWVERRRPGTPAAAAAARARQAAASGSGESAGSGESSGTEESPGTAEGPARAVDEGTQGR